MRTVYLGHNLGYVQVCYEETELLAVFWHSCEGSIAKRCETMLEFCQQKGVVTIYHPRLNQLVQQIISALKPDLIVVGEYHFLLKKEIIEIPRYGAINLHGSPLPRYRGAHPINWMIINGETEGAVTCHYITEGLDDGDIIAQYTFPILETETAYDVRPKTEVTGQRLLRDVLERFKKEGRVRGVPQDESKASYYPPRTPEDGLIDWNQSSKQIYNFVRALTKPYPGAFALLGGGKVYLWRMAFPDNNNTGSTNSKIAFPGTVIQKRKTELRIAVKGDFVTVTNWETEGREIRVNDCLIGKEWSTS